jgi:8-oxo-dGTP pyrophosphatase MutT (NUDIX family)
MPAAAPIRKAFAYITHRAAAGERLLIFSHPRSPAAGLQVPAGTVEDGETPEAAALREAEEETGLEGLVLVAFLGERTVAVRGRAEVHHRFFFHLRYEGEPPAVWRRTEDFPSGRGALPKVRPLFELFWVPLPDGVPELSAGHDALLPRLIERLAGEQSAAGSGSARGDSRPAGGGAPDGA